MYYQSAKIPVNRFLPLVLIFFPLHWIPSMASCSEIYRINNQSILLYKTINWWYDCLADEQYLLCGKTIQCTNNGNALIEYTQSKSTLKISIKKGLADQLSIFKNCDGCLGPSSLHCIWSNKKYFGKGKAAPMNDLNQFVFFHIDKIQARVLKDIEKDIVFIVEGNIMGLMNDGKIALHNTGPLLKRCPNDTDDTGDLFPVTVKIINAMTEEIIAKYLVNWSN